MAGGVPALPYHALVDDEDAFWLLGDRAAVRVGDGSVTVARTGEHTPSAIRRAAKRTWILTTEGLTTRGRCIAS